MVNRQSEGFREQGSPPLKRLLGATDIFILFAILLVALAVSAAIRFEANFDFLPAISIGIVVFITMAFGHGLLRRRVVDKERSREQSYLWPTPDFPADWQSKLARVDELANQLKRLEGIFSGDGLKEAFAVRDRDQQKLAEKINKIEQQLSKLRNDFHRTNIDQQQFVRSKLQLVETLIKQVTEKLTDGNCSQKHGTQQSHEASDGPANSPMPPESLPDFDSRGHSVNSGSDFPGLVERDLRSGLVPLELVRESVEMHKIDLYLQPVVTLPTRKVCYYEVLTRLRTASEQTILPANYIPVAEQAGLMPLIDNVVLFRSMQIMSLLAEREPARGLFCNISPRSLLDAKIFKKFREQYAAHAGTLCFEFGQPMIKECSAVELDGLAPLFDLGFRFSMDNVTDLNIDFSELQARGFRFIKVDAGVLTNGMSEVGSPIQAAELKSYLKRYGIELIVQKIEGESQLSELLKFGVEFGQGFLFGEPRPVRPEIFGHASRVNNAVKAA